MALPTAANDETSRHPIFKEAPPPSFYEVKPNHRGSLFWKLDPSPPLTALDPTRLRRQSPSGPRVNVNCRPRCKVPLQKTHDCRRGEHVATHEPRAPSNFCSSNFCSPATALFSPTIAHHMMCTLAPHKKKDVPHIQNQPPTTTLPKRPEPAQTSTSIPPGATRRARQGSAPQHPTRIYKPPNLPASIPPSTPLCSFFIPRSWPQSPPSRPPALPRAKLTRHPTKARHIIALPWRPRDDDEVRVTLAMDGKLLRLSHHIRTPTHNSNQTFCTPRRGEVMAGLEGLNPRRHRSTAPQDPSRDDKFRRDDKLGQALGLHHTNYTPGNHSRTQVGIYPLAMHPTMAPRPRQYLQGYLSDDKHKQATTHLCTTLPGRTKYPTVITLL